VKAWEGLETCPGYTTSKEQVCVCANIDRLTPGPQFKPLMMAPFPCVIAQLTHFIQELLTNDQTEFEDNSKKIFKAPSLLYLQ
jgi:hypothetical protein